MARAKSKAGLTYQTTEFEVGKVFPTKNGYDYFVITQREPDLSWVAVNNTSRK